MFQIAQKPLHFANEMNIAWTTVHTGDSDCPKKRKRLLENDLHQSTDAQELLEVFRVFKAFSKAIYCIILSTHVHVHCRCQIAHDETLNTGLFC